MRRQVAELDGVPVLETERTTLRAMSAADTADLHAVYSDAEVMRYWSSPPHADEARTRQAIAEIAADVASGEIVQWAIERRDDNRVIGSVTLMLAGAQPRAELGFILGREHWGRGYAGEAQRRVVQFAFEVLELHRLEADTHPDNAASARSLERLGFRREGVLRERWEVAGEFSDSVLWGLLASEWRTDKRP